MKKYPLDKETACKYGIQEWRKIQAICPVNYEEYCIARVEVFEKFAQIVSELKSERLKYVFNSISLQAILRAPLDYFYHSLLISRLKEKGWQPTYDNTNNVVRQLIEDNYFKYYGCEFEGLPSLRERFIRNVKQWVKNLKLDFFGALFFKRKSYSFPHKAKNGELEVAQNSKIFYFYPFPIFSSKISIEEDEALDIIEKLSKMFKVLHQKHNVDYSFNAEKAFKQATSKLIDQYIIVLNNIEKKVSAYRPKSLFLQSLGTAESRLVASIGKRHYADVISFGHGNEVGIQNIFESRVEISADITTYYCTNKRTQFLINKYIKQCLVLRDPDIQCKVQSQKKYLKRRAICREEIHDIENIMVVEAPLKNYPVAPSHQWNFLLGLQLTIAEDIKISQLNSIIKVRPGSEEISASLYGNYYDVLEYSSFEETYDNADVLVFPFIQTTTFGYALTTKKKIIIFEHSLNFLWQDIHEKIKDRCIVIPSSLNMGTGLEYDREQFKGSLNAVMKSTGDKFLKEFYFPDDKQ